MNLFSQQEIKAEYAAVASWKREWLKAQPKTHCQVCGDWPGNILNLTGEPTEPTGPLAVCPECKKPACPSCLHEGDCCEGSES